MEDKYIQDADKLIKDARSTRNKNVVARTKLVKDVGRLPLPSFTQMRDSFKNLVSGMGGKQAKSSYTTYRTTFCMDDMLLYSLYESHGLSRKIATVIPEDATKNDITIKNDNDNVLKNKWSNIKAIKQFFQADLYRRFFGGAIIYMDIDDGQDLTEPVNINNIKSVRGLRTYCRTDVFFTNIHFDVDVNSENYGQPEFYTITPKYSTPFNIHYTRVLEFKGKEVPSHLDNGYRYYWGQSIIEILWQTLKKVGAAVENLDQLLYEMTISIYKIKGLADMICAGNWTAIKNIIDQTDLAKSTIRSMLIDTDGQEYSRDSLQFSGVKEVLEILFTMLTGETDIPMIRLFGKQAGGLNNTGEGELKPYNDSIKSHQKNELTDQAQTLIDYINMSKEVGNKKVVDAIVEFVSPDQLTEKEELANKKTQSEVDKTYVDMGAVSNSEIRELRFENDYTHNMNVSELESYNENLFEEPEEEEENEGDE